MRPRISRVETNMHSAIATKNSEFANKAKATEHDKAERVQNVMQRVGSPGQLPRAEIGLAALLIQIGEDQEQQKRNNSRDETMLMTTLFMMPG